MMAKIHAILLVLSVSPSVSQCEVVTLNNATDLDGESHTEYGFPIPSITAVTNTFCPSVTVSELRYVWPRIQETNGSTFYLKRNQLSYYRTLNKFARLLSLPDHIGLHEVVTFQNVSIPELEAALEYAWQPSIESHIRNTSLNITGIRILKASNNRFDSFKSGFTGTGWFVRRYLYTLAVSDTHRPTAASVWRPSQYAVSASLPNIPSPDQDDFVRRLYSKGVIVYKGPIYYGNLVILKGDLRAFDFEQIKRGLISDLEMAYNKSYKRWDGDSYTDITVSCNMSKGDINVQLGPPTAMLTISRVDNPFSQTSVFDLPYLITIRDKIYAYDLPRRPSAEAKPRIGDISVEEITYQNKTLLYAHDIFRLYSSQPVNFQLLPVLAKSVAKLLSDKLRNRNRSAVVRFVDPDLDNATTVSLTTVLTISNFSTYVVAALLFHDKQMYSQLEGVEIDLETPTDPGSGGKAVQLSIRPFPEVADPQRRAFLQRCTDGQIIVDEGRYGDCPLSDTFTLHLLQREGQFPLTSEISNLVQEAFVEANPVKYHEAYFMVALEKREEVFRDAHGLGIVRFDFSFSYFNLTNGKFWNVWRFPTNAIVRRLSILNPPITIGDFLLKQATCEKPKPGTSNEKSEGAGLSSDVDAVLANSTFSLYLVINASLSIGEIIWGQKSALRSTADSVLRAVGAAFTEANSRKTDAADQTPGDLGITLTGYDDDFWTLNGRQVTRCDFTLASRDVGQDLSRTKWRYPSREVLQKHLLKTASAQLADDPFN